jgi:branched-chain amino acid transport system ATP-binding protein/sulfate-transporting ATPase
MEGEMKNPQAPALLHSRNLTKRFGGVVALNDLSLEVFKGEILGLIGPNGSGKTTFFNVVTGIYKPTEGRITFDGTDVTGFTPQQVYGSGITRTFQRSRLCISLTIFDNIVMGNHRRLRHGLWFNLIRRKALKAELEQNHHVVESMLKIFAPHLAVNMFVGISGVPMIDRRRIEICRALISDPKLLLLDEPSAGMTHEETRQLMDDILEIRSRMNDLTIVIIEHEMNVIEKITDRCVVLNYGEKICEGSYAYVASNELVKKAYLGNE